MKNVKDFRTDCKSACKRDCYAGGCPHAGAGDCARFEKLLDFEFETLTGSKTNEKTTQETSKEKDRKTGQEKDRKTGHGQKKSDYGKGRRALQV